MALSKTAKYYRDNPEARKKKAAYDKEFNKRPEQRKKNTELRQHNRVADRKGVDRVGKDASHTSKGIVYKKVSKNRGSSTDSPGDRRARGKK